MWAEMRKLIYFVTVTFSLVKRVLSCQLCHRSYYFTTRWQNCVLLETEKFEATVLALEFQHIKFWDNSIKSYFLLLFLSKFNGWKRNVMWVLRFYKRCRYSHKLKFSLIRTQVRLGTNLISVCLLGSIFPWRVRGYWL